MSRGRHTPSPIREATPPHPRTSSLCVRRTLLNPAALTGGLCSRASRPFLYACLCVYSNDAFTRVCTRRRSPANPSHVGTHTRTHAYTQPGTRTYRKAEIDNAGGPPAPYLNMDTRPAVAPGPSRRRDGALPSSLPLGFCAESRSVPMQQINPAL